MSFDKYAQKGNLILEEIALQLGMEGQRDIAFRVLRSVLHTLRDRLPVQESFHLLAQLPIALKGIYVEGWKYQDKPNRKIQDTASFIRSMITDDYPAGHHDFASGKDAENAVRGVLTVLKHHITSGESSDISKTLPPGIRSLWTSASA
ncbi:MAG: DUF2267 domain-containing protein [Cyclobacteriaceae bacterium]